MHPPSPRRLRRLLSVLALGLLGPAAAAGPGAVVDATRFELLRDAEGYRLAPTGPEAEAPIPIPREWLEPPREVARADQEYVSRFDYSETVHSFAVGGGRLGLHLSSYAIQSGGSAAAASGRDVVLIYEPDRRRLRPGLDLGLTKGRVRLGGCLRAHHHRIFVGDVDGDRLLDVGTIEERIDCELDPHEPASLAAARAASNPAYSVGAVEWHLQGEEGWVRDPAFDGRLPIAGFRELPLIELLKSPVDFALERLSLAGPADAPPPR